MMPSEILFQFLVPFIVKKKGGTVSLFAVNQHLYTAFTKAV